MLNFRRLRGSEITECDHLKSCKAFLKKVAISCGAVYYATRGAFKLLHEFLWHKRKHFRINLLNW